MSSGTPKPLKILCVDDEDGILEVLREGFVDDGFEVLTASDVDEALAVLGREGSRIVLVLSDYSMPGKTGYDLRTAMLAEHKQIPFVLMSGHISREDALRAVELKIAAFQPKPFQLNDLRKLVGAEARDRVNSLREDDEMLAGFVVDAGGLLEEMETLILSLDENPGDQEALNRVFACAHTVKGASGFFKPDTVHRFTHRYEDFLSTFKKNPGTLDAGAVSVLLKGLDVLKRLVRDLEAGVPTAEPLESLVSVFAAKGEATAPAAAAVAGEGERAAPKGAAAADAPKSAAKATEEIRVSLALLNEFMEKSGEITVLRNMVNKILHVLEAQENPDPNLGLLSELMGEMHKVVSSMQEQLGDLRKIPFRQVTKPLARTLRDLTVTLKKRINFETVGDDLRIDHTLADILNKCLIHMLRNSADHGVEGGAERVAAGKPEVGTIRITCEDKQDIVLVTIQDDGRGIDATRVRAKAVEKGILSEAAARSLSDDEARLLIFEPGFSTAEQVTDVSGRGVGTDMVKQTILSAGGTLKLRSVPGKGTTFELHLPAPKSVLIISSLMVRVGGQVFAVPQENLVRVVGLPAEARSRAVREISGALFFRNEDELIPLVKLESLLRLPEMVAGSAERSLLWVRGKSGTFCFEVDEVLDTEEIVVKRLGKWFNDLRGYSGATFLGDGRVGLVLSVDGLGELLRLKGPREATQVAAGADAEPARSMLLFDLGGAGRYALPQASIYRLEELNGSDLTEIGGRVFVRYRGQAVPLVFLAPALEGRAADTYGELARRAQIPTVLVEQDGRLFALPVSRIGDFVAQVANPDAASFHAHTEACIVGEEIVTLLHPEGLLRSLVPTSPRVA